MKTFGIFNYFEREDGLILPFFTVGIYIERNETEIANFFKDKDISKLKYLEALSLLHKFNYLIRILSKKEGNPLKIYVYEEGKYELEKYGIKRAFLNRVKFMTHFHSDSEVVVGSNNNWAEHLELTIGFLYSKVLRLYYLKQYNELYPQLEIIKHKGKCGPKHMKALANLSYLPNFYIESLTITYLIKYFRSRKRLKALPTWAKRYREENYERPFEFNVY